MRAAPESWLKYTTYRIVTLCFDSLVIRLSSKDLKHLISIRVYPDYRVTYIHLIGEEQFKIEVVIMLSYQ